MKAGRKLLGAGALASLVALAGILVSALPGHVQTEGSVVRAEADCVMQGKTGIVNGTPTCDCTTSSAECGCIIKAPCPPGSD